MSEPKTRPSDASVQDFLAAQAPARRADCEAIAGLMEQATGEPPVLWGASIVGFGRYAAARSDGKTYDWPVIGFSPRSNDLALYVMSGFAGQDALLSRLGKHRTGKSCLYIKRLADVDAAVLRQLVQAAVGAMAPRRLHPA